jgi:hypothetical protein
MLGLSCQHRIAAPWLLFLTTMAACTESSIPEREVGQERIKAMIGEEIGPGVRFADNPFVDDEVRLYKEPSTAVPGLVYYWGRRPPTSDHGPRPEAIVATRSGAARLLRSASDWTAIVAGWEPIAARDAIAACTEFASTTLPTNVRRPVLVGPYTGHVGDDGGAVVMADTVRQLADSLRISQGLSLLMFLSDSASHLFRMNRERITAPQAVRSASKSWEVTLWQLRDLGAFRYRCTFPRIRWWNRAGARLIVDDSVP